MRLLFHVLVVFGVLIGSDLIANEGAQTQKLVQGFSLSAMWNSVKVQNYQATATLKQKVYTSKPQLSLARMDD
jgi:hypothetical protein